MSSRLLLMQCHKKIQEGYIPVMTSDTDPTPFVASASTVYVGKNDHAYYAFDDSVNTLWHSLDGDVNSAGKLPQWLKIKLDKRIRIYKYLLTLRNTYDTSGYSVTDAPIDWKVQGSNDDTNWTDLDVRSNIMDWSHAETRFFILDKPSSWYQWIRIYCTKSGRRYIPEGKTTFTAFPIRLFCLAGFQIYQYK